MNITTRIKKKILTISLDPEIVKKMDEKRGEQNYGRSEFIREALRRFFRFLR